MERNRRRIAGKIAVAVGTLPLLLWAYEYGPNAGYSGVPNENGGKTCATSGCHTGTANDPNNKGSVTVAFPNGSTYAPGVKQHLVVTIADPAASQRAWGFQLTARLSSDVTTPAGTLASTDANTLVMCASAANLAQGAPGTEEDFGKSQACPTSQPLQYIEHSLAGYNSTRGKTGSATYEFDWTPPATASGNIDFYIAGNAANGDLSQNGDHIYTSKLTLSPGSAGSTPAIGSNGIVNGASFQPGLVPGSWFTINGTNLSSVTDDWSKSIVNGQLPTKLDNVSVDVGGKPAYVYYVSPTQINAVAPTVGTGSIAVTVTTAGGSSPAANVSSQQFGPAFFLWPGSQIVATRQDFSLAVKAGTFSGAMTVAAKPGDVVILWGTGFGPTSPTVADGVQVPSDRVYNTGSNVTVTINNTSAQVFGCALAPGFAGLYQVAIQVPASLADGDWPIKASIGSFTSPDGVVLSVKK